MPNSKGIDIVKNILKEKLYIIILAVLTLVLSAAAFIFSFNLSTKSAASTLLRNETSVLRSSSSDMMNEKADLTNTVNNVTADLSAKDTINQYYVEYKKKNEELQSTITDLKSKSAELDDSIKAKRQEVSSASSVKTETKGKSYTLKANEIYTCPSKLAAGRYTASGSGTLVIYSSNGSARVNENLDTAYKNSYTFDLKENEQIRTSAEITLTEIK